ncbi:benzoate 4-monooxygenase cytochrome P450, putative [Paecilomyces variotii No. 5]|uniref:Benzoate 4-monooxygenase cytochrome P450, putative n=1 Tax=Byssochlamys spectabilis (strain No. 5 / NBRC 109023) TaxID=1356009 RepID=V5FNC5_BYSSN|nr:benzoate 4-monooxygenase cytochrome P450, putative [Paecilomyces variotii No. 5]
MTTYTPRVRSKVDSFISQLRARVGQPVNITEWSMFLTFDVMGVVGFSKDFHQLEDAKEHSVIKGVHDQMATIGLLSQVPWFLYLLGSIPGLTGTYRSFMEYCARQVNEKKALWEKTESQDPVDIISWLLKAVKDKDSSAPPSDGALQDDGRVVIIAGSDTTGATLANAFYFLTTNQHIYKQLQRDLDTLFSDVGDSFTYEQVRNIPYVEAIIHETLRLKPAVPSGPPRVTPPGGLQVDEVWIPGDVNILVPPYILQRDDRNFVAADKFMPERWLVENKKRMILNDQAFFPFQIGPYGCVGKQLAYMNLRLAIVLVALNFDLGLAPGEDGVEFDKGAKDTFTLTLSPLQVIFNERAKA